MTVELAEKPKPELVFDAKTELAKYSKDERKAMLRAGATLLENLALLKKSGHNMVGQCLAHQGTFYEENHYPKGDVYDAESHSQYYYHAHRPESGEHGHFHTFVRASGMPTTVKPAPYSGKAKRPKGKDALAHIVAISMDGPGMPIGLFTTNRWVTDETFYSASDVAKIINRFTVEQTFPCLATNRCVTALIKLFKPQILALAERRDAVIADWAKSHPDRDTFEDRELEITSIMDINIDKQISILKTLV